MHAFDPSQPHGQVCGGAVRLWEQNGIIYDVNHDPVELLPDGTVQPIKAEAKAENEQPGAADDYKSMSVEKLKQVCAVYGVEFKNRQQAIAELEGR